MEDKLFLLLMGGLIGILSSVITIGLKERLERAREKRKLSIIQKEIEAFQGMNHDVPKDHPLFLLLKLKSNLSKELEQSLGWDEDAQEKVKLYLDIDSQILRHSEYLVQNKRAMAKDAAATKNA